MLTTREFVVKSIGHCERKELPVPNQKRLRLIYLHSFKRFKCCISECRLLVKSKNNQTVSYLFPQNFPPSLYILFIRLLIIIISISSLKLHREFQRRSIYNAHMNACNSIFVITHASFNTLPISV